MKIIFKIILMIIRPYLIELVDILFKIFISFSFKSIIILIDNKYILKKQLLEL